MGDVALAVYQGESYGERVQALTASVRERLPQAPKDSFENLQSLADSVGGSQGRAMRERLDYVAFCKAHGIEP